MSDKFWIQTYTGKKFYPITPDSRLFDIRDQARALSMTCRYVGHVSKFYSVAEHAVRVSRLVERHLVLNCGFDEDHPKVLEHARWGLVHDNSEAYLGDVSRPVKHQPVFEEYRKIEKHMQRKIAIWLGLDIDEPALVTWADSEMLGTEARQLKNPVHPDWHKTCPTGELPAEIPGMVLGWDQATAERIYLKRFERLFGTPQARAVEAFSTDEAE